MVVFKVELLRTGVEEDPQRLDRSYQDCCLVYEPGVGLAVVRIRPLAGDSLLKNDYFEIAGLAGEPARSSRRGNLFFKTEDPRFLEVQTAYTLAKVMASLWERFRYRWPGPRLRVNFSEDWEPQQDFPRGALTLSVAGGVLGLGPYRRLSLRPHPLRPTIIAHEFAHFLFWDRVDRRSLRAFVARLKGRYGEGWRDSKELFESRAVQEGFCDYLAGVLFEDPDVLPELPLRHLADEAWAGHRLARVPHLRGWGQFLWKIRGSWPQEREADAVAYAGLEDFDQAAGLRGAAEALKRAAQRVLGGSSARRYQEVVEGIARSTRLLEPPLPSELSWSLDPDRDLLRVGEEGEFFLLGKISGLILQGKGPGSFPVPRPDPLSVYREVPEAVYLGLLREGKLWIAPPRPLPPKEYPRSREILVTRQGSRRRGEAETFRILWASPHRPAALFLCKARRADREGEIPPAEPLPLGEGSSQLLWGAKYRHEATPQGGRLELEIPSFWLSRSHLVCVVRAQTPSGWVESPPLPLEA